MTSTTSYIVMIFGLIAFGLQFTIQTFVMRILQRVDQIDSRLSDIIKTAAEIRIKVDQHDRDIIKINDFIFKRGN